MPFSIIFDQITKKNIIKLNTEFFIEYTKYKLEENPATIYQYKTQLARINIVTVDTEQTYFSSFNLFDIMDEIWTLKNTPSFSSVNPLQKKPINIYHAIRQRELNGDKLKTQQTFELEFNAYLSAVSLPKIMKADYLNTLKVVGNNNQVWSASVPIRDNNFEDFCNALKETTSIKTLHFSGVTLDNTEITMLANAITNNQSIINLDLERINIKSSDFETINNILKLIWS